MASQYESPVIEPVGGGGVEINTIVLVFYAAVVFAGYFVAVAHNMICATYLATVAAVTYAAVAVTTKVGGQNLKPK